MKDHLPLGVLQRSFSVRCSPFICLLLEILMGDEAEGGLDGWTKARLGTITRHDRLPKHYLSFVWLAVSHVRYFHEEFGKLADTLALELQ